MQFSFPSNFNHRCLIQKLDADFQVNSASVIFNIILSTENPVMGVSLRKGKAGALKAFVRRAPGHKSDSYETTFDRFCDIYDLAVISIDLFPTKIKNNARFSRFEDIDYDRCMVHIDQLFPGYSKGMKTQILHWVIF